MSEVEKGNTGVPMLYIYEPTRTVCGGRWRCTAGAFAVVVLLYCAGFFTGSVC